MWSEREFLLLLEERAREEKKIVLSGILPAWAARVGDWLGVNPWRLIAPLSCVLYLFLRAVFGEIVAEVTLAIFGGFRW